MLEKDGDGYRNSPLAEEFLVRGKPYYFGGQVSYCDQRTYLPWHRIGVAPRTDRATSSLTRICRTVMMSCCSA
ncbi:hypothetical protein Aab01nite_10230 [Paractinoplanes abujensis]|nr:hypothetical protein Aab01nite_10230 [Actinoplanes abujensis]